MEKGGQKMFEPMFGVIDYIPFIIGFILGVILSKMFSEGGKNA